MIKESVLIFIINVLENFSLNFLIDLFTNLNYLKKYRSLQKKEKENSLASFLRK